MTNALLASEGAGPAEAKAAPGRLALLLSRLPAAIAFYGILSILVLLLLNLPNATDYVGADNDDVMRLIEVRDLLGGQGWFDLMQYRLGLGDGTLMHWSRLIDLPLAKVSTRERGWWMTGDAKGKAARTAWRLLDARDGRALVEFRPATGRTHQIRVHALEGLGHAVTGDPTYGATHPAGMMLHAAELVVPRPGKEDIAATAPWPERFTRAGFDDPGA